MSVAVLRLNRSAPVIAWIGAAFVALGLLTTVLGGDGGGLIALGIGTVEVATSTADTHPVGSTVPVRYDPARPRRAELAEDRPNPYEPVLTLALGVVFGLLLAGGLGLARRRRKRRALALLRDTAPMTRVRVEAWRREVNNTTLTYLSVNPGAAPGGAPLVVVPIDDQTVRRLHAGDRFDLYGTAAAGTPPAVGNDDLVVVPSAKTRPASWEAKRRAPTAPSPSHRRAAPPPTTALSAPGPTG